MQVLYFMLLHFVADFMLQSPEMGRKKSESLWWLSGHVLIHLITFFILGLLLLDPQQALIMSVSNAVLHGLIDWNIWRLYKRSVVWRNPGVDIEELKANFKWWEDFVFIAVLGFDQLLHYICIVALYNAIV